MEQSAPVSLEAVCSGIVLPVVTNVVVLVAVYAMPMGVAQAVSIADATNVSRGLSNDLLITIRLLLQSL